ncbi:MAG TPA: energy transducer TonB [Flavitalea sp.]|nr:energy transducer TonB [Flavitalea sp.]
MNKVFSTTLLLFVWIFSFGQRNQKMVFRFWNAKGKATTEEAKARFFTTTQKLNDTCWQIDNYKMMGPMICSKQFKDKDGKVSHGRAAYMREDGTLDSIGSFANGVRNGMWIYFNNNGVVHMTKEYSMDELLFTWNAGEAGTEQKNPLSDQPDTPAEFPGGKHGWTRYLIRNLRYPQYAMGNNIVGSVKVLFMVDEKGRVTDDIILKSAEFTLDNEARRLLHESHEWIPATKNGRNVKSYQQTGVEFKIAQSQK